MSHHHAHPFVAVIDGGYEHYQVEKELLSAAGYDLKFYNGDASDQNAKAQYCRQAEGILLRSTCIDAEFLDHTPSLRAVVRYGIGVDNLDIPALTRRGIAAANVRGYATHAVSDHALMLLFTCLRGGLFSAEEMQQQFGKPRRTEIWELHTKTLGIIGMGRIGGMLCRKVQPLFNRILGCDPFVDKGKIKSAGAEPVDLNTLLQSSHVISLHCDLNDSSKNLLSTAAFERLQHRPILINTARGGIVNEQALLDALQADSLHSAGLDVFQKEPPGPRQNQLLQHPRVYSTGHVAWYSQPAAAELQRRAAKNLVNLLTGKEIDDCLNPQVLR